MLIVILAALAIGISLGLLGSGGSILTVPVLVYLLGQQEKVAIAGSLAIVGTIALVGAIPYMLKKMVDWRNVLWFGIPGMIGTYFGAYSTTFIPGIVQMTLFAVIMLVASYKMINASNVDSNIIISRSVIKIGFDGLSVGVITGIVGVGGGFLIVPALVVLGGLSMRHAVATSLVIIAMKSYSGFYKYLDVLQTKGLALDWNVILIISAVGIIGSFLGNLVANKLPQQKLKQVFGGFLIVMAVYILFKTVPNFF